MLYAAGGEKQYIANAKRVAAESVLYCYHPTAAFSAVVTEPLPQPGRSQREVSHSPSRVTSCPPPQYVSRVEFAGVAPEILALWKTR